MAPASLVTRDTTSPIGYRRASVRLTSWSRWNNWAPISRVMAHDSFTSSCR